MHRAKTGPAECRPGPEAEGECDDCNSRSTGLCDDCQKHADTMASIRGAPHPLAGEHQTLTPEDGPIVYGDGDRVPVSYHVQLVDALAAERDELLERALKAETERDADRARRDRMGATAQNEPIVLRGPPDWLDERPHSVVITLNLADNDVVGAVAQLGHFVRLERDHTSMEKSAVIKTFRGKAARLEEELRQLREERPTRGKKPRTTLICSRCAHIWTRRAWARGRPECSLCHSKKVRSLVKPED